MAHDIHIKARAMADLLTGEPPIAVAAALRVPYPTVRRWKAEAWAMVRASFTPEQRAQVTELRKMWPGFKPQNDHFAWGSPFRHACGAKTRSGEPCLSAPVRGKRRCRMHGGRV